ncbi:MAG: hypothetical protein ACRDH5_18510, partial [bacterium]
MEKERVNPDLTAMPIEGGMEMPKRRFTKVVGLAVLVSAIAFTWIAQGWAYEVWVTNQDDHTVSVIDTQTNKVLDTIT